MLKGELRREERNKNFYHKLILKYLTQREDKIGVD
jgi:hypothetical protein